MQSSVWFSSLRPVALPPSAAAAAVDIVRKALQPLALRLSDVCQSEVVAKAIEIDEHGACARDAAFCLPLAAADLDDVGYIVISQFSIAFTCANAFGCSSPDRLFGDSQPGLLKTFADVVLPELAGGLIPVIEELTGFDTFACREVAMFRSLEPAAIKNHVAYSITFTRGQQPITLHLVLPAAWLCAGPHDTDLVAECSNTEREWHKHILEFVTETDIVLSASVAAPAMTFNRLSILSPGDVIALPSRSEDTVDVSTLTETLFQGRLGRIDDRLSVRVTGLDRLAAAR